MKYKAIIFDLDGTLLNTLDDLYYSTNYALKYHNMPQRTYEEVRCFVGNGVKVLIEKAVSKENPVGHTPCLLPWHSVFSAVPAGRRLLRGQSVH